MMPTEHSLWLGKQNLRPNSSCSTELLPGINDWLPMFRSGSTISLHNVSFFASYRYRYVPYMVTENHCPYCTTCIVRSCIETERSCKSPFALRLRFMSLISGQCRSAILLFEIPAANGVRQKRRFAINEPCNVTRTSKSPNSCLPQTPSRQPPWATTP